MTVSDYTNKPKSVFIYDTDRILSCIVLSNPEFNVACRNAPLSYSIPRQPTRLTRLSTLEFLGFGSRAFCCHDRPPWYVMDESSPKDLKGWLSILSGKCPTGHLLGWSPSPVDLGVESCSKKWRRAGF